MRIIALIVLLTFTSSICFAADTLPCTQPGIFFDADTAARLDGDIKFYKKTNTDLDKLLSNCKADKDLGDKEIGLLKKETESLKVDLNVVMKAKDDYKELYVKADEARLKELENKPSRMTWFGLGAATSAVITTVLVLLLKR